MKNFFALTLIAVATIVMSSHCEAFQPPGGRGQGGQRGGPGGERGGPGGGRGGPGQMEIPIIKALDTDGDGKISGSEMANAATALATLDKNGDGVLEHSEMMPARGGRRGGGPGGQGGPRGGSGGGGGDVDSIVERMLGNDTDGDGKVSLAEAPEYMKGFFDRIDGDKDGFLNKDEITTSAKRWAGGGGGGGGGGQRPKRPGSE